MDILRSSLKQLFSSCSQGDCGWRKASSSGGGQVCEDPKCKGEYFGVKTSPAGSQLYPTLSQCFCIFCLQGLGELGVAWSSLERVFITATGCLLHWISLFLLICHCCLLCVELTHAHTDTLLIFLILFTPVQTATQLQHTSVTTKLL